LPSPLRSAGWIALARCRREVGVGGERWRRRTRGMTFNNTDALAPPLFATADRGGRRR
jgi:hypothetical protein